MKVQRRNRNKRITTHGVQCVNNIHTLTLYGSWLVSSTMAGTRVSITKERKEGREGGWGKGWSEREGAQLR